MEDSGLWPVRSAALIRLQGLRKFLHVDMTRNERKYGFASMLEVECLEWGMLTDISTSKQHRTGKRGPGLYYIDLKHAFGNFLIILTFILPLRR